jgi:membrane fusion protein, heavy metal efflux system
VGGAIAAGTFWAGTYWATRRARRLAINPTLDSNGLSAYESEIYLSRTQQPENTPSTKQTEN